MCAVGHGRVVLLSDARLASDQQGRGSSEAPVQRGPSALPAEGERDRSADGASLVFVHEQEGTQPRL